MSKENMIFVHDITLPKNGDVEQDKFVDRFNSVSELYQKSQDSNLTEEEQREYLDAFWGAKYCLEQGIG